MRAASSRSPALTAGTVGAGAGSGTLAGWEGAEAGADVPAPPPPPPHPAVSSAIASNTRRLNTFMRCTRRGSIAEAFIVSIAFRSYVLVWGRRQHTSTCERGVPSVGCTSPHAAASDSLCVPQGTLPKEVYGGKEDKLSRRMSRASRVRG